jgi:hypothetical protein
VTRDDVINEVYRSLRDAFNSLTGVTRKGNSVVILLGDHKATINFRIKLERAEKPEGDSPF